MGAEAEEVPIGTLAEPNDVRSAPLQPPTAAEPDLLRHLARPAFHKPRSLPLRYAVPADRYRGGTYHRIR